MKTEFDSLSRDYAEALKDPVRDRFNGGNLDFFHERKRQVILSHFNKRRADTSQMTYLDLGCGKGELAGLLRGSFAKTCGCDPSEGMMRSGALQEMDIETRLQTDPERIPFSDNSFDFVTAVCVYHHVPPEIRVSLTTEVARILKPGGTFAVIEHNPFNPVTRLIVSRTPIDADALLLTPAETKRMLSGPTFQLCGFEYFLYFPERIYRTAGALEGLLRRLPLGGQYAAFARRLATSMG